MFERLVTDGFRDLKGIMGSDIAQQKLLDACQKLEFKLPNGVQQIFVDHFLAVISAIAAMSSNKELA